MLYRLKNLLLQKRNHHEVEHKVKTSSYNNSKRDYESLSSRTVTEHCSKKSKKERKIHPKKNENYKDEGYLEKKKKINPCEKKKNNKIKDDNGKNGEKNRNKNGGKNGNENKGKNDNKNKGKNGGKNDNKNKGKNGGKNDNKNKGKNGGKNGGKNDGKNGKKNNNKNKNLKNPKDQGAPGIPNVPKTPDGSPPKVKPQMESSPSIFPSSSAPSQTTSATTTHTNMSNVSPNENENKNPLSIVGVAVISAIFAGIIILVGLAVYRKRNSLRKGAVRLYDDPEQNSMVEPKPKYLSLRSLRSLRVPSMPPQVQLSRLSSPTIQLPFKENNRLSNKPTNNVYLSPNTAYTRTYELSDPYGGTSFNNGLPTNDNDQRASHPSSHESYSSLESSFPVPPQRVDDSYSATPTSATFGDIYNLKII